MSKLEEVFALQLQSAKIDFVRELVFCPGRKWRADFAVREIVGDKPVHLLLEVQGIGPQGRHGGWNHIESDSDKFSTAAALGYRVMPFTGKMIASGRALALVEAALCRRDLPPILFKQRKARSRVPRVKRKAGLPERVRKAAGL